MTTSHRFGDAICPTHRDHTITHGWPFPGANFHTAWNTCPDCAAARDAHTDPDGGYHFRAYHNLPNRDNNIRHSVATHEAAHAVVGVHTGHTIDEATITPDDGDQDTPGGRVGWTFPTDGDLLGRLAMDVAGEIASLRWLIDHGHDTPDNRFDARYLSSFDIHQAATTANDTGLNIDDAYTLATHLTDQHWPTITALAALLTTAGHLDGPTIHTYVTTHTRLHRAGSSR